MRIALAIDNAVVLAAETRAEREALERFCLGARHHVFWSDDPDVGCIILAIRRPYDVPGIDPESPPPKILGGMSVEVQTA